MSWLRLKILRLMVWSKKTYTIVSALRGPDRSFDSSAKMLTMAVIRYLVGMRTSDVLVYSPERAREAWLSWPAEQKDSAARWFNDPTNYHFMDHFRRALGAIGTEKARKYDEWFHAYPNVICGKEGRG